MFGSAAIDLAWLAEGKTDGVVMLSNKPWDTAAGVILVREAGALVVDTDGSDQTTDATATVTVAPELLDALLALIRPSAGLRVGLSRSQRHGSVIRQLIRDTSPPDDVRQVV